MIRVFVRAGSTVELAGLEALVRSASSLELAGSSLARSQAGASLAAIDADVLLERPLAGEASEAHIPDWPDSPDSPDPEARALARVWVVPEAEFELGLGAMREGAVRALLPAWATGDEIRAAIEAAAAGLVVLHPDIAEQVTLAPATSGAALNGASAGPGQQLSPRESEVLNLLAGGLGNKQIAGRLGISEHTVKFHITSIFNKLAVGSRAEAVAVGVRRGLIVL